MKASSIMAINMDMGLNYGQTTLFTKATGRTTSSMVKVNTYDKTAGFIMETGATTKLMALASSNMRIRVFIKVNS